jgi:hypothetical protein
MSFSARLGRLSKRCWPSKRTQAEFCQNQAMALMDEIRMDRSVISVVTTETPYDAKELS